MRTSNSPRGGECHGGDDGIGTPHGAKDIHNKANTRGKIGASGKASERGMSNAHGMRDMVGVCGTMGMHGTVGTCGTTRVGDVADTCDMRPKQEWVPKHVARHVDSS